MATMLSPPDQRILLDNIAWELYESLLAAHRDRSVPRFTYALDKLSIFAHVGVPEVWRYGGERLRIHLLAGGEYVEHAQSGVLQGLTGAGVTRCLNDSRTLERLVWLRRVREWARAV